MCDYSGKLIAWLDKELPENDAAELERHVRDCGECRERIDAYSRVSRSLEAYCDAVMLSSAPRRVLRWALPLSAAAGAAAAVLILVFLHRPAAAPLPPPLVAATPSTQYSEMSPPRIYPVNPVRPIRKIQRRNLVAPVKTQSQPWAPTELSIEIAIPADAMFSPGAVPDGISFVADVNFGADGSVERLRLKPRLVEFERRKTRP